MHSQHLPQYKGQLSSTEVTQGINCAKRNAQRLLDDAETLVNLERYPSALALAVLAIEEVGKVPILRAIALAKSDKEAKSEWREYRSHKSKNRLWPLLEFVLKGARKLDDFSGLFVTDAEHPAILDQLKQISFYTDCLGKRHWSIPSNVIERDLAMIIVETTKLLVKGDDIDEREIELWVQHMSPVWKERKEVMEKGLVDWYAALQDEGIKPEGGNDMKQFILNGVTTSESEQSKENE